MAKAKIPHGRLPRKKITREILRAALDYNKKTGKFRWKIRDSEFLAFNGLYAGKVAGYHQKATGYIYISIFGNVIQAHRLCWLWVTGKWPSGQIDHKNCNRRDNRWNNLRTATHGQNCHNSRIGVRNTSGIKGVSYDRARGKWVAEITSNKVRYRLGRFGTAREARAARRKMASRLHGKFARHA